MVGHTGRQFRGGWFRLAGVVIAGIGRVIAASLPGVRSGRFRAARTGELGGYRV